MTKTIALISALALAAGLSSAGAQAAPTHKTTSGELASRAQLAREHARAVKAGDTANDPANSSSSDSLNQQQLAKAQALPGTDVQPGAINSGATNTSGADANTPTPNMPAPDANNSMPNNSMPNTNTPNDNMTAPTSPTAPSAPTPGAVPPAPPSDGPTPGTQTTPQGNTTSPQ